MKNLLTKTKNFMETKKAKTMASLAMLFAMITPTFCDIDLKGSMNKVLDLVFMLTTWAGIILTVLGIIKLGKAIMDSTSDNGQSHSIGGALAMLVFGILMLAAKSLLTMLGVQASI